MCGQFFRIVKEDKEKQPIRIKLVERKVFAFAGLWSLYKDADNKDYYSFSIITATPNNLTKEVHDHMPVTLAKEEEKIWLDIDQRSDDLTKLLHPNPADGMEMYKVRTVRNNYPELLDSRILTFLTSISL